MLETVVCDLCGQNRPETLADMQAPLGSPERLRVVICLECGFIYFTPRLSIHTLKDLYTSANYCRSLGFAADVFPLENPARSRLEGEFDVVRLNNVLAHSPSRATSSASCRSTARASPMTAWAIGSIARLSHIA